MLNFDNGEISVVVDLAKGARVSSIKWHGLEFALQVRPSLMDWGWYAMVPWAGRIRNGLIVDSSNVQHKLPTNWDPPHAEHGFGFFSPWLQIDQGSCVLQMPAPYLSARAIQTFELLGNSFSWELRYEANDCDLPAWIGFHPWFRRDLGVGKAATLNFSAGEMLVRGVDGIPTGEFSQPKAPPWDDAFAGVETPPFILWEGAAAVTIDSVAPWWVVYTEDPEAICIEPQTAPPDASNLGIAGAHTLRATFTFSDGVK